MPYFEKTLPVPGLDRSVVFGFEFDTQPSGPDFENTDIFFDSAVPLHADDGGLLSTQEKQIAQRYIDSEVAKHENGIPYQIVRDMLDGIED